MLSTGFAALLVTSCASPMSGSYDAGGSAAHGEAAPEAAAVEGFSDEAGRAADGALAAEEQSADPGLGTGVEASERSLIHIADLTVRVEDVPEATRQAKELTVAAGGHVASESLSTPTGGIPEAYLTLRVPSEDYEDALEDLAELGDRSDLDRSVEDVTAEVADVESRIESAETALETLRGYLEEAENVDDLLRVEREIQDRQAELEAFQARLKALEDQTTLSTVNLTLVPPQSYVEEPPTDGIGFGGGLERGWRALTTTFDWVAVAVGWALPFLAVLAVPAGLLVWWLRSRRRRAGAARTPDGTGTPAGGAAQPSGGGAPVGAPAAQAPADGADDAQDGGGSGKAPGDR
ncbi:DUF4349 domain-containing protein [Nocardiopsis dassonvillei]|uniref:DUF4349 domain-containing protein n=1 Tax=Nocardiopsis dassonvillei TaxID=2014 RepID=UPI003F5717EE